MIFEGINIEEKKYVIFGITKIFGIGIKTSKIICKKLDISKKKMYSLSQKEREYLKLEIKKIKTESNLKNEIYNNIKRLIEINSYRGTRHKKFLPSRGQKTRNNSNTRRKRKVLFFIKK